MNHLLTNVACVPLLAGKQCFSRQVRRHCFWRSSGTLRVQRADRRRSSGTASVRRADRRRGAVLVMVLVCAMVALAILVSLVKLAAAGRRMVDQQSWQVQAVWLAESGLERAAWRLAADADYKGETWTLPADQLAAADAAVVQIRVETIPEQPNRRLVRVRADYPDHPTNRVRLSKQAVVELPLRGEKK